MFKKNSCNIGSFAELQISHISGDREVAICVSVTFPLQFLMEVPFQKTYLLGILLNLTLFICNAYCNMAYSVSNSCINAC